MEQPTAIDVSNTAATTTIPSGLTSGEARRRLEEFGPNPRLDSQAIR
jgi:hypothetical protein